MERTAIAGMRRCLKTGRGLRCTTQPSTPKCIAAAICPARSVANTAGISSTSAISSTTKRTPTTLRTRLADNSLLSRRGYRSTSALNTESSPQGTIGQGASRIPLEASRTKESLVAPTHLDEAEKDIFEILNKELEPDALEVKDISGGCGSMYAIDIKSERFRGLGMLKQQRLVNEVLKGRVEGWHGVQMKTGIP